MAKETPRRKEIAVGIPSPNLNFCEIMVEENDLKELSSPRNQEVFLLMGGKL